MCALVHAPRLLPCTGTRSCYAGVACPLCVPLMAPRSAARGPASVLLMALHCQLVGPLVAPSWPLMAPSWPPRSPSHVLLIAPLGPCSWPPDRPIVAPSCHPSCHPYRPLMAPSWAARGLLKAPSWPPHGLFMAPSYPFAPCAVSSRCTCPLCSATGGQGAVSRGQGACTQVFHWQAHSRWHVLCLPRTTFIVSRLFQTR